MELTQEQKDKLDVLIETFVRNTRFKPYFKSDYAYREEELEAEIRDKIMFAIGSYKEKIECIEAFATCVWNRWKMDKWKHYKTKQFDGYKGTTPMSLDVSPRFKTGDAGSPNNMDKIKLGYGLEGEAKGLQKINQYIKEESTPEPFETRVAGKDSFGDTSTIFGGYFTRADQSINETNSIVGNALILNYNAKKEHQPFSINDYMIQEFHKLEPNRDLSQKKIYEIINTCIDYFIYVSKSHNPNLKREEGKKQGGNID